jgi:hypothetical protein
MCANTKFHRLPALELLESFIDPSNYLRWALEWNKENPEGHYYAWDNDLVWVPVFEADDFLMKVRSIISQLKVAVVELRAKELAGVDECLREEYLGYRLRVALDKARSSHVMLAYEPSLDKIFSEFEQLILKKLGINIVFSEFNGTLELHDEMSVSSSVHELLPQLPDLIVNNIPTLISYHLGHFSAKTANGELIMTPDEYNRLVTVVEDMLTKNYSPVVQNKFAKLRGVTNKSLAHSFYRLMKAQYPKGVQEFFPYFLKNSFEQLSDTRVDTITTSFSQPDKFFDDLAESNPFLVKRSH